jgi:hypothetical protein
MESGLLNWKMGPRQMIEGMEDPMVPFLFWGSVFIIPIVISKLKE